MSFARPLWREFRRYSSILYFNARVPHLEPDFRLVLNSYGILPIAPPPGEAYHILPGRCTIVVAGAISLYETASVYQAHEETVMSKPSDHKMDDGDAELHIEVMPLSAPAADPRPTRPRPHARLWRALIAGTAIAVALVVIFSGFAAPSTRLHRE